MTNLTLSLDEEGVKRARIRAIGEGTSLNAKVREFLAGYALITDQSVRVSPFLPPRTPTTVSAP